MATGGTDHMIRVYYLGAETPMKVSELNAHTVKETHRCSSVTVSHFQKTLTVNIYLLLLG